MLNPCDAGRVRFARILLLLLLLLALAPAASADGPDWQEVRTAHFVIATPDDTAEAQRYAGFVDGVYDEMTAIYGYAVPAPVTLRLYPDDASYIATNPLAAHLPGVVAHATSSSGRHDISIDVQRTKSMSSESIVNNVRHELTHLILADLSDDHLPVGWHEGIAQYSEKPLDSDSAQNVRQIRRALAVDRLMTWDEINAPGGAYGNPTIAYPESLSMVAFLVDRYGFDRLVLFVKAMAKTTDYRVALEKTYNTSADKLEAGWRAYLPDYVDTRYAVHALYAYDMAPMRSFLEAKNYAAAKREAEDALPLLRVTGQTEQLVEAESILATAAQGMAEELTAQQKGQRNLDNARGGSPAVPAPADRAAVPAAKGGDTRSDAAAAGDALRALDRLKQAEALAARNGSADGAMSRSAKVAGAADQRQVFFLALGGGVLLLLGVGRLLFGGRRASADAPTNHGERRDAE
ncbi:MAG: peptidase MA family metallohydrolase [Anaerolineae bacterium]